MAAPTKKAPRDVNQNVHRILAEVIRRSEEPPQRGNLKVAGQEKPKDRQPREDFNEAAFRIVQQATKEKKRSHAKSNDKSESR